MPEKEAETIVLFELNFPSCRIQKHFRTVALLNVCQQCFPSVLINGDVIRLEGAPIRQYYHLYSSLTGALRLNMTRPNHPGKRDGSQKFTVQLRSL